MSAKKIIVEQGKDEFLRIGFGQRGNTTDDVVGNVFNIMALGTGVGDYNQSSTELIQEIDLGQYNYNRIEVEYTPEQGDKKVEMAATVLTSNIDPDPSQEMVTITEIGLVNSLEKVDEEIFFCLCQMPPIPKNKDIALLYMIVVELE